MSKIELLKLVFKNKPCFEKFDLEKIGLYKMVEKFIKITLLNAVTIGKMQEIIFHYNKLYNEINIQAERSLKPTVYLAKMINKINTKLVYLVSTPDCDFNTKCKRMNSVIEMADLLLDYLVEKNSESEPIADSKKSKTEPITDSKKSKKRMILEEMKTLENPGQNSDTIHLILQLITVKDLNTNINFLNKVLSKALKGEASNDLIAELIDSESENI